MKNLLLKEFRNRQNTQIDHSYFDFEHGLSFLKEFVSSDCVRDFSLQCCDFFAYYRSDLFFIQRAQGAHDLVEQIWGK